MEGPRRENGCGKRGVDEDCRAISSNEPPWFKAISEAAIRIRELEQQLEEVLTMKLDAAEEELARYQQCYWANEGKYEALVAQVAKLRLALEKIAEVPGSAAILARAALQKDQGE